jgi:hypothetical protein
MGIAMTDHLAETLAEELLRDPAFRTKMRALIEQAFEQALKALSESAPAAPTKVTP